MNESIITLPRFASELAAKTAYKADFCERFAVEVFKIVEDAIKQEGRLNIKGLGEFRLDEDSRLMFMPDSDLADTVNAPFACFEAVELDDDFTDEMLDNEVMTATDSRSNDEDEPAEADDSTLEENSAETVVSIDVAETTDNDASETDTKEADTKEADTKEADTKEADTKEADTKEADTIETDRTETDIDQNVESEEENFAESISESYTENDVNRPKRKPALIVLTATFIAGLLLGAAFGIFIYPRLTQAHTPSITAEERSESHGETSGTPDRPTIVSDDKTAETVDGTQSETEINDKVQSDTEPTEGPTVIAEDMTRQRPAVIEETVTATNYLATMARRHYGRFEFWVYIYEENRDKLDNPDRIEPKTVVVIPPAEKYGIDKNDPQSVDRAIKKAAEIYSHYK